MVNARLLEKIKLRLGANYRADTEEVLKSLLEDYTRIASLNSNRKEIDEVLEPFITTAVIGAYLRLGNETMINSSEGGISNSYIDIEDKLAKDCRTVRVIK